MGDESEIPDYAVLKRKRSAQQSIITKTLNSLRDFQSDDSPHLLTSARDTIRAASRKFNGLVEEMLEHPDADEDELDTANENFRAAFAAANALIEDESEKLRHVKNLDEVRSLRDEFVALKFNFDEFKMFSTECSAESTDPSEILLRLKDLEELKSQHDDMWKLLFSKESAEGRETMQQERATFSAEFYKTLAWFHCKGAFGNLATLANRNSISTPTVKLPKIELPTFDGSPDSWITFRDTYMSLIHNVTSLSGALKFRYLKASIIDKNSPIRHLLETDSGYEPAWNAVLEFYDDKRRILDCHLNAMLKVKPMDLETHEELQRVLNDYTLHISALERMHNEKELYRAIVAHLVLRRLDSHTRDLWETENKGKTPFWPELQQFLKERRKTLSSMPPPKASQVKSSMKPTFPSHGRSSNAHSSTKSSPSAEISAFSAEKSDVTRNRTSSKCHMCSSDHRLYMCPQFANLSIPQRLAKVREWKICSNCFGFHAVNSCNSKIHCRSCRSRHHTMLHVSPPDNSSSATHSTQRVSSELQATATPFSPLSLSCNATISSSSSITLFQTAIVQVKDAQGNWHNIRAFLDSGSDSNFISTSAAMALKIPLEKTYVEANGIGGSKAMVIKQKMTACVRNSNEMIPMEFLVASKITNPMPSVSLKNRIELPPNISLADPTFAVPGKIDMLIGNEHYGELLRDGRVKLSAGPVLLNTAFGWILTGTVPADNAQPQRVMTTQCHHSSLADLRMSVEKFYNLEDYRTPKRFLTAEETHCEQFFEQTHQRSPTGRFIVTIPYKPNLAQLKNNFKNAMCQFLASEKRWQKNESLRGRVIEFMQEYEGLGHMTLIDISHESPDSPAFYMPYHAVEKPDSTTTKLRVVFNGSARTPSGISLNDTQCVGPQVQNDVFTLSLRFRTHEIVIKADLEKMYRQVDIANHQRRFQRIIFREKPEEKLKVFELNTITYGTSAASFQATRCLQELGSLYENIFPEAARDIIHSMYVDDLMAGAKTVQEAKQRTNHLLKIFDSAGMKLRKFSSNNKDYLKSIPEELRDTISEDSTIKALGSKWNPEDDTISFVARSVRHVNATRRIILSEIASNWDVDGLLGPVTFSFKKFLKVIFNLSQPWDSPIPPKEAGEWSNIASTFEDIGLIKIPRKITIDDFVDVQLHGFSDASDAGYGACIYVVSRNDRGERLSRLLCAKSRVAPKEYRSTARLELCGAVVLANLMDQVSKALDLPVSRKFCWTDSAIVLFWLLKSPSQLQTFVANRVSEIQELSSDVKWLHVRGPSNPADLLSRGLTPAEILNCQLWWNGPEFLLLPEKDWPESIVTVDANEPAVSQELKRVEASIHAVTSGFTSSTRDTAEDESSNPLVEIVEKSSRLFNVKWKFAIMMRFIHNARAKRLNIPRHVGPINVKDLLEAEHAIARIYQRQEFPIEYQKCAEGLNVPRSSKIKNLDPIYDPKLKLMRVGGRLSRAEECGENQKHPIILPNSHFTKLVIRETHEQNLHAGINATHSFVRLRYWPVHAKKTVRFEIHRCVKCFRARPKLMQQMMGQLPPKRVTPSPPFEHTGVDFAGPFDLKVSKLRTAKFLKSYVSVFVCFSTKAVHMEIVTDLNTEAFLAAFDKFVSRRGLPKTVTSDHGLNFVGARNKLFELHKFLEKQTTQAEIREYLARQEIQWNFIPPRAPSQGGLWEAAVKSMKHHFYRVAAKACLTFEEFDRLKAKIEAILNSRPLTAISDDPTDFSALTAGHFLIGRPLIAKPERDLIDQPLTRLQRWDRVIQMQQHFWNRWSREYLHLLQVRTKNFKEVIPVTVGQLVLLQVDNTPSMHWPLARIVEIFPGDDGVTRIAKLQTASSNYERPVNKLALLPIDLEEDNSEAPVDVRA